MRRALLVFAVLLVGTVALGQEAAEAPAASGETWDNLYLEAGGGSMMPEGEDATGLLYGSANYGMPLVDELGLGLQAGGKVTVRDNDADYLAALGLFQRDVTLGMENLAWSVQGIYHRTWDHADLFSLKPALGMELDRTNCLVLTGVWGLNDEHTSRVPPVTQQDTDVAMLLWGTAWQDNIRTEIGGGYAFGEVDAMLVGVHGGMQLDDMTSVNVTGQFDFDGNYYAALAVAFDLGAGGRNATFNNVSSGDAGRYTPMPLGSLPVIFYETIEGTEAGGLPPLPPG